MAALGNGVVILVPMDGILKQFGAQLAQVGEGKARQVLARALNYETKKTYTQVKRSLAAKSSIKYGEVGRRTTFIPAGTSGGGDIQAIIRTNGDEMGLGAFGPRQLKSGASAKVWGRTQRFAHAFVVASLGGNVFVRKGPGHGPIKKLWGPNLGRELVRDYNAQYLLASIPLIQARVEKELATVMRGH